MLRKEKSQILEELIKNGQSLYRELIDSYIRDVTDYFVELRDGDYYLYLFVKFLAFVMCFVSFIIYNIISNILVMISLLIPCIILIGYLEIKMYRLIPLYNYGEYKLQKSELRGLYVELRSIIKSSSVKNIIQEDNYEILFNEFQNIEGIYKDFHNFFQKEERGKSNSQDKVLITAIIIGIIKLVIDIALNLILQFLWQIIILFFIFYFGFFQFEYGKAKRFLSDKSFRNNLLFRRKEMIKKKIKKYFETARKISRS